MLISIRFLRENIKSSYPDILKDGIFAFCNYHEIEQFVLTVRKKIAINKMENVTEDIKNLFKKRA